MTTKELQIILKSVYSSTLLLINNWKSDMKDFYMKFWATPPLLLPRQTQEVNRHYKLKFCCNRLILLYWLYAEVNYAH